MQTSGGVDDDDIGLFGESGLEGIEGHGGGVGAHALLDDGDVDALGPEHELLDGGGAEGVGGTEDNAFASGFVSIGQFGDGGGLAHAVDAYDEDDVGFLGHGGIEVGREVGVVLSQELCYLGLEDRVEFGGGDIAVAFDALLQVVDDFERGLDAYVGGDEGLLEVVEHLVVDGGFAEDALGNLLEERSLGLLEALVEGLFLFFFAFANEIK